LKNALGSNARDFQVVFITLDPQRDSARVLKSWLSAFDATFIGLRGNNSEIRSAVNNFRVFAEKVPGPSLDSLSYTINHSTFTYIFDTTGKLRLVAPIDLTPDKLASDVERLLKAKL